MNLNEMTAKQMLQAYLMASYAYYIRFASVMPDTEYDALVKRLLELWDTFEHQHKHLVTWGDLKAGTLYGVKEDDYPTIVKCAAEMWMRENEVGKLAGE